jgi:hypothetical protein
MCGGGRRAHHRQQEEMRRQTALRNAREEAMRRAREEAERQAREIREANERAMAAMQAMIPKAPETPVRTAASTTVGEATAQEKKGMGGELAGGIKLRKPKTTKKRGRSSLLIGLSPGIQGAGKGPNIV